MSSNVRHFAAENISVAYRGRKVVDNISFSVKAGEWLAIVGPNGAGKSTLLKAASGLLSHDGQFLWNNKPVAHAPAQRAKQIAYLPQRLTLPQAMNVYDYVLLGRTAHISWLGRESKADKQLAAEMLALVDASAFEHRYVTELSGGELQRVALARALCQQSKVLLLDEPASALDIGQQSEILQLLHRLQKEQNLAVVTVLHDLTHAGRYCDNIVLMKQGRSFACGHPEDLLQEEILRTVYGTLVRVLHDEEHGTIVLSG